MKIRFDYSWMPAQARKDIEEHDPTKKDFAITQEDYAKIGNETMETIKTIARKYVDLPNKKPPYIIMASSGKTLFALSGQDPDELLGKGSMELFDKNGEKHREIPKHIHENTSGYEIIDDSPPKFYLNEMNLIASHIFKRKMKDNIMEGVRGKTDITIDISYIKALESNVHMTVIVDGSPISIHEHQNGVHIPKDAKEVRFRISDQFGNARELVFSRIDIDNRVIFIKHIDGEKDQQKMFQQHLRRLIDLGYDVYIGGDNQEYGNPLAYLMKHYGEQLFSTPDMHLNKKIEIQDLGQIENKRTSAIRLVNWLTGQTIFSKTWKHGAELKEAIIANTKLYLDPERGVRKLSMNDIIPGEKRATPILIARSEHRPTIPDKLSAVHFNIDIAPDIAWGWQEFEIGNTRNPIRLTKTAQELMDEPIAILGNIQKIAFKYPYSVKQPLDAEILVDKMMYGQHVKIWKWVDFFGNVVVYNKADHEITILPKKPANNSSHFIDLVPLGIGVMLDLVIMGQRKPIATMGENKQYQIFAHERHLTSHLQPIIKKIEDAEHEFGAEPGYFVNTIHIDEDMGKNALIMPTDSSRMTIFEGMLNIDNNYIYHEVLHMIDYKWHISSHPEFQTLYKRINQNNERFFTWINESNFFPKGFGGHAQDNEGEFFASLGNSLTSSHIKTHLERSDPDFVRMYQTSLQTLYEILKKCISRKQLGEQIPFLNRLEKTIALIPSALQASEKMHAPAALIPSALQASEKMHAPAINVRSRMSSQVSLFSKWKSPLTGGIIAGNGIELPLINYSPFSGRLYMGGHIAIHNDDHYISLLPEVGLKPVFELGDINIVSDIGGVLRCEWDNVDYGLSTGLFIEYAYSKNMMHRWGIKALSFSNDDIWLGLQFSGSLLLE